MDRGKFIVIEGIDGSGKTTVYERLMADGVFNHAKIREPGTTKLGEELRRIVKSPEESRKLSAAEQLHYFFTARISVLTEVVDPMLQSGTNVLTDRFDASTFAYQVAAGSHGNKKLTEHFWNMRELYIEDRNREPDVYIWFDLDPETAISRTTSEARNGDHFDRKPVSYFHLVRQGYRDFFKEGINHVVIDASRSVDDVYTDVLKCVNRILAEDVEEAFT